MSNGLYAAIAQGGQPIQIENPLNQMAKISAIRNAQQEQELNALKLTEGKRSAEESEALRNYLAGVSDLTSPEVRTKLLTGFGKQGIELSKTLGEREKSATELATKRFELVKNKTNYFRDALTTVNTPQDAQVWTAAIYADPDLGSTVTAMGGNLQQALARIPTDPAAFNQWKQQTALGAQKFIELNAPKLTTQDIGGTTRMLATPGLGGPATVVPGSVAAKTVSPDTAARLEQERNIPLQTKLAEAKEYGQTVGKSRATSEAALPGAVATAEQTVRLIDEMIGKPEIKDASGKVIQKATKPHPGFQEYVGATAIPFKRFIEGTDVAGYERYQLQVEGKAFLEAFEALKGGGAITEIEGSKGTQAIMRMNKAQSEKEYVKAARELQDIVRKGVERAKAKAGGAAPSGGAAPTAAPQAPMYARNPSTGERIMSTDGGVTWNPAR